MLSRAHFSSLPSRPCHVAVAYGACRGIPTALVHTAVRRGSSVLPLNNPGSLASRKGEPPSVNPVALASAAWILATPAYGYVGPSPQDE